MPDRKGATVQYDGKGMLLLHLGQGSRKPAVNKMQDGDSTDVLAQPHLIDALWLAPFSGICWFDSNFAFVTSEPTTLLPEQA